MSQANTLSFSNHQQNEKAAASLKKIVRGLRRSRPGGKTSKQKKLRILSIDGGGIRAILPAVLLAKLEERLQLRSGNPQARIVDHFDLFAGTSAGGILCSLYLTPSETDPNRPKYTAREVLGLYLQDGCESFTPANPDPASRRREKYSSAILEDKLQYLLGINTRFTDLLKPTLITAYNTETELPVYFESWRDKLAKAWEVARATSAAPGMYKAAQYQNLESGQSLIDGSIFASNPAMCAYALANNTRFSDVSKCSYAGDCPEINDFLIFSVGTGRAPMASGEKKESWIRIMMKSLMSSGTELVDRQLLQLFSEHRDGHYFRFNPSLAAAGTTIDDVGMENVKTLRQIGVDYFDAQSTKIDQLLDSLLA